VRVNRLSILKTIVVSLSDEALVDTLRRRLTKAAFFQHLRLRCRALPFPRCFPPLLVTVSSSRQMHHIRLGVSIVRRFRDLPARKDCQRPARLGHRGALARPPSTPAPISNSSDTVKVRRFVLSNERHGAAGGRSARHCGAYSRRDVPQR
jgi:hypothetical protein